MIKIFIFWRPNTVSTITIFYFPESPFLKQAFEGEYPKLLRLYNELWARLQQFVSTGNPNNVYTGVTDVVYGLFHLYQDSDTRFIHFSFKLHIPSVNSVFAMCTDVLFSRCLHVVTLDPYGMIRY